VLARAVGNRALAARLEGATLARLRVPASNAPALAVARQPPAATPPATTPEQHGDCVFVGPLDWGQATTHGEAIPILRRMQLDGAQLQVAGFGAIAVNVDEAATWIAYIGRDPSGALSLDDARQLNAFSQEFQGNYRAAIGEFVAAIVKQLLPWRTSPMSDEDLFELREAIHDKFVHHAKEDVVSQAVELLRNANELTEKVEKWVGYGAKAEGMVGEAKMLEELEKAVAEIKGKISEAKEMAELARNIGRMVGVLGGSPAGIDDVGAMESALDVCDFAVGKLGVPGFNVLWSGYILKLSKMCLERLRSLKALLYAKSRAENIRFFFEQHRGDVGAPDLHDATFYGLAEPEQHFPGGQAMLNFMWRLMRDPDSVISVPSGVEDWFVKWREEMGAGEGEAIESDSSWRNLWNVFSRERAPNLLPWVKSHAEAAWVKLYGGMPHPG
jgi:hypothetical protein